MKLERLCLPAILFYKVWVLVGGNEAAAIFFAPHHQGV